MVNNEPLQNDLECPLLTLTNAIIAVSLISVLTEVSIMHECNTTCIFDSTGPSSVIDMERESIETNRLSYIHNLTNDWYCLLNIFCMHQ